MTGAIQRRVILGMRLVLPVLVLLWPTISGAAPDGEGEPPHVRNIILMIGDGMGLAQLALGRIQKGELAMERAEHFGWSWTSSLEDMVTDSSAGATALASGYRIRNGEVGIHPDGTPTRTVLEYAEDRGLWTGLVVTCRVTHATPASMATHVKSRDDEDRIAEQLAAADIEVIFGGGWDKFLPRRELEVRAPANAAASSAVTVSVAAAPAGLVAAPAASSLAAAPAEDYSKLYGTRADGKDLLAAMRARGYRTIYTAAELSRAAEGPPRKVVGLFARGPMPKVSEGRSPALTAMTRAALRILGQSPKGFFLMVEGSQIDWGGHANDAAYVMTEAADFDDAVGEVFDFLRESGLADDTLVVITADHETGGLALNKHPQLRQGIDPHWTTDYHTAVPVPVFSSGPHSELFERFQDHARIGRTLIETLLGKRLEWRYPGGLER